MALTSDHKKYCDSAKYEIQTEMWDISFQVTLALTSDDKTVSLQNMRQQHPSLALSTSPLYQPLYFISAFHCTLYSVSTSEYKIALYSVSITLAPYTLTDTPLSDWPMSRLWSNCRTPRQTIIFIIWLENVTEQPITVHTHRSKKENAAKKLKL